MSYIFEGEVIKLNAKDWAKWSSLYPSLNLAEELVQLDAELEAKRDAGESVKKWFVECLKRLNGRNKRAQRYAPKNVGRSTRDIPLEEEINNRSWADIPITEIGKQ